MVHGREIVNLEFIIIKHSNWQFIGVFVFTNDLFFPYLSFINVLRVPFLLTGPIFITPQTVFYHFSFLIFALFSGFRILNRIIEFPLK